MKPTLVSALRHRVASELLGSTSNRIPSPRSASWVSRKVSWAGKLTSCSSPSAASAALQCSLYPHHPTAHPASSDTRHTITHSAHLAAAERFTTITLTGTRPRPDNHAL